MKKILSLLLCAALCMMSLAAIAETDTYTTASATKTVLTGEAYDAAAAALVAHCADLATLAVQTIILFVAVMAGIFVIVYILPVWKIMGHRDLAFGVSVIQLMGFPANYLVVNEVANASTETEEEKKIVLARLMPAYIISNFVSVTSLSIVVAGFCAGLL
jgi:hypothetical protein